MDNKKRKLENLSYRELRKREDDLDEQIEDLVSQGVTVDLKPQMEALHKYNEIKDATQLILGYLADIEQKTIKELHLLFNLPLD